MEHTADPLLLSAFVFLAAAVIIVPMARKTGLGSVLGYLFAGIFIGPYGLSFVTETQDIMHFAEYGVIMMLFLIGMELNPKTLWAMRRAILGLGGMQVIFTTIVLAALLSFLTKWQEALCVAAALSLSSTAMVLQILGERNLTKRRIGRKAFSVLLFQDIAVIPMLALMPIFATFPTEYNHFSSGAGAATPLWVETFKIIMAISVIFFLGRFVIQHAFDYISASRMREIFTASSLLLIIAITLFMKALGISAALGAFMAGVVLANSSYRHTLEADIQPFKGLLLGLFFISVGMSINFELILQHPLLIICGILILLSVKAFILYGLAYLFKMKTPHNMTFSLLLCQSGEFAFVIMQAGTIQGVFSPSTASIVSAIAALSMMLTPLLLIFNDRLVAMLAKSYSDENPEYDTISETDCPVIIAGYGRVGQLIGRLLDSQGLDPVILEQSPEQINLLRHFGNKVYFGDAMRFDVLRAAGIEKAKYLVITLGSPESVLTLTKRVKEKFPHIKIFVRARNRRHAYELHKAGADIIRRELFDSSLWLGQRLLEELGMRKYDARTNVFLFKKHDQEVLEHSFDFFDNEKEMLSFTRQSTEELQQILTDDKLNASPAHYADGWGSIEEDVLNDENRTKEDDISPHYINAALKDISNDNMGALTTHYESIDNNDDDKKDE